MGLLTDDDFFLKNELIKFFQENLQVHSNTYTDSSGKGIEFHFNLGGHYITSVNTQIDTTDKTSYEYVNNQIRDLSYRITYLEDKIIQLESK